jgi:hypothetical protein
MRLIASVLWLVELAACASEPARAPTPQAASQPPPVVAPGTLPSGRSEFDQQLDTLAAGPPRDAPGLTSSSAPAPVRVPADGSTRSNISTITPYLPPPRAYLENLAICLDGRFPAFCDHGLLVTYDAQRVRNAEYEANLVTCIDPQWQHLCRPDLLPADVPGVSQAPSATARELSPN